MNIGLDIMGGDFGPERPLEGVNLALNELEKNFSLSLYGDKSILNTFVSEKCIDSSRVKLVFTSNEIEMGESPTKAISQKLDSSIMVGLRDLKDGIIDAFISAGNTGAMYVGAMYTIRPIEGVIRPTLSSILPKENGGVGIILDVGANADCKPDVLYQFGVIGSVYARCVYHISNPKVGLLSVGSEREKGNLATQAAYPLFESSNKFSFYGNVEGYDLFDDKVDVIVCDGFTGNIVLKTGETFYKIMKRRGLTDSYFKTMNYELYGGSPILGINKPVIIGHGISTPLAFKNLIKQSMMMHEANLVSEIKKALIP